MSKTSTVDMSIHAVFPVSIIAIFLFFSFFLVIVIKVTEGGFRLPTY